MSLSSGRYWEPPPELRQGTASLKSCRLQSARDGRRPPVWSQNLSVLVRAFVSNVCCLLHLLGMVAPGPPWSPSILGSLIIRKQCDCTEPSHSHQALNHLDVSLSLLVNFVFSYFCICTLYILIPVSPPLSPSKFLKTPVAT